MIQKTRFIGALCAVVLSAPCMGREADPPPAVHFSAFSVGGPPPIEIFVQNLEEVERLGFERRARGRVIEYQGANPVTFFRKIPQEDGTHRAVSVGQVTIPPEMDQVLLLFIPNFRGRDEPFYRILAVNDEPVKFPAGSLRVFNGMGEPIYGMLGDTLSTFGPGFSEPHSLLAFHGRIRERTIALEDGGTIRETDVDSTAPVRLSRRREGRFEHVYDSPLRVHPKGRYILLVFPSPDDPDGIGLYTQIIYELMR